MNFDDLLKHLADDDGVPGGGAVEPTAAMRHMALQTYQTYRAYVDAGFSEDQALTLTLNFVNLSIAVNLQQRGGD